MLVIVLTELPSKLENYAGPVKGFLTQLTTVFFLLIFKLNGYSILKTVHSGFSSLLYLMCILWVMVRDLKMPSLLSSQ